MLSPEILADPVELTRALVDVESVSGNETRLAGQVEAALRGLPHLSVERIGNVVIGRTGNDRQQRVILAGHLDTVPVAGNLPSRTEGDLIHGCGTADMKSGAALALHLAATVEGPRYDVTYLFYDCEEVESERNGLYLLSRSHPDRLTADFAILLEPTYGLVEAGCQGTLRAMVTATGRRAHSARSWLGANAIHAAGTILRTLEAYTPRSVTIDGCTYREGLNAVRITGPRAVRRVRRAGDRLGAGREAGAGGDARQGVPGRDRPAAAGEAGLDRRGPVCGAGRARAELRAGRSEPRAYPRGARGDLQDPGWRRHPSAMARRVTGRHHGRWLR